tara:strand:- start:30 stop:518 length:489 start_codon:yes stop_codon:yes gene_type:complete
MITNTNTSRDILHTSTDYLKDHEVERAIVYMHDNTTETVINTMSTPETIGGAFEYSVNDGFSQGVNSITYSGKSMTCQVIAIFSIESGNNQDLAFYVSKNGTIIEDSEGFVTTDSGGKATNVVCQTIIDLVNLDEITLEAENYTSTHNITVDNLSLNIISIH